MLKRLESNPLFRTMMRVFKPHHTAVLLLLALIGCSTSSSTVNKTRAPDWDAADEMGQLLDPEEIPEPPQPAPPPSSPAAPLRAESGNYANIWIPLNRWSRERGFGPVREVTPAAVPTYSLTTSNGTLLIRTKSHVASWNGLEFHLGFQPQWIDGQAFVHALDLGKNIEPLLRKMPTPWKSNGVIVIDPGHGGSNLGASNVVDGTYEKELTLDWALQIEPLLEAAGWRVYLTRTNDAELSLAERVAFAERHQADLFVSLHFNSAAPSQTQAGIETYCLTPTGMPSNLTRGYEDDTSLVFANNAFDRENWRLGFQIHRHLLEVAGADRGLRHARFLGVLRGQNRPAILVEGGFLSNPDEARRISDAAYREQLAIALADALLPDAPTNSVSLP